MDRRKVMFSLVLGALAAAGCSTVPPTAPPAAPPPRRPPADFGSLDDLFTNDPDPRRNELVLVALSQLGIPYLWGGNRPEAGFDCSGLVRYVYWQVMRVNLPRVTWDQARAARPIDLRDLRPADLVFFNTLRREFSHVGLYLGRDRFVHAPATGGVVRVEPLSGDYWRERFNGARRIVA